MRLRWLTGSPYTVSADGHVFFDHARTASGQDAMEALAEAAPHAAVQYFRERIRRGPDARVLVGFDNVLGEDRFFFFVVAPPASEAFDLEAFVKRLERLRYLVIGSGIQTLVLALPGRDYFGIHPDALVGMMREVFAADEVELIVVREPALQEVLEGIAPVSLTQVATSVRDVESDPHHAAVYERLAHAGRQARAMLAEGIAHEVKSHGHVVGTVRPNPDSWHPGATDRFLLRENSTGMHWHAASVEEAEATLLAVVQARRGTSETPRLRALFEWLGGPPQHLQEFVRHLVDASQRRERISDGSSDDASRFGSGASDRDRAEAFARTVDLRGVWAISAELRALEEFYKTKHRSQRKRLLRTPQR